MQREQFETVITVCKKMLPMEIAEITTNIYLPLTDGKQLPIGLDSVVDLTVESCSAGAKTLVHCYLGRNRSFLVTTLAYARLMNMPIPKAFSIVKEINPRALTNRVFEEYLVS